ncbi:MAG: hypothetical protein AAGD13_10750 [Pseudomonadota bacterium]
MRVLLILCLSVAVSCRPIYTRDVANFTAFPEPVPPVGTPYAEMEVWFEKRGYAPAPEVWQAEGELRRVQGGPLVYALEKDRMWWQARVRAVQDFCVTQKFIYYRLDLDQRLVRAIQNSHSQC